MSLPKEAPAPGPCSVVPPSLPSLWTHSESQSQINQTVQTRWTFHTEHMGKRNPERRVVTKVQALSMTGRNWIPRFCICSLNLDKWLYVSMIQLLHL